MEQKHGLRRKMRRLSFLEYPTEEFNYKFSAECPRQGTNEKTIILIHVDDLIFTGGSKRINEIFSFKDPKQG